MDVVSDSSAAVVAVEGWNAVRGLGARESRSNWVGPRPLMGTVPLVAKAALL